MRASTVPPEGRMLLSRLVRHARLRQLQLLLALRDCGSVVRAAQQLDISQSAATQALAELERVLDARLFERHARGLRPTPAGQALTDAARGIMSELEDVAETLAALRLGASAALRLGAIPSAAHSMLPPLLARFYLGHPRVHVDVQEREGARLLALLLGGALDAVFCRQPASLSESLAFRPLLADAAVFVAAPGHPLARARRVGLGQLAGARWVLPTSSIAVRDVFERVVLAGLPQAHWFPVSTLSLPVLKSLLAQPGAVTLVPRSILPALGAGGLAHGVGVLDMVLDPAALALAPLGVAYARQAMPALLGEMLAPCGDAGLVAGPDGLVACG